MKLSAVVTKKRTIRIHFSAPSGFSITEWMKRKLWLAPLADHVLLEGVASQQRVDRDEERDLEEEGKQEASGLTLFFL